MNSYKCPIQSCGRVLQSDNVLKQHLKRRHPNYNSEASMRSEQDRVMQEQINKLPKLNSFKLKINSGQQKLPEIYRRSSSKGKGEGSNSNLNTSKITSVISETRSFIETTQNTSKATKKFSLSKKQSTNSNADKGQKLPEIKTIGRPKKLQILNEQIRSRKPQNQQQQMNNLMYSTAPNFKKLEKKDSRLVQRADSKQKQQNKIEQQSKKLVNQDLMFIKTQQGFHEKQSKIHKPLKRHSDRNKQFAGQTQSVIIQPKGNKLQAAQQQTLQQKQEKQKKVERKSIQVRHQLKLKNRRQASLRRSQVKKQPSTLSTFNYEERIIVFDSSISPKLALPAHAKSEYLFANNCKLTHVSLGSVEFLRQISLQHNLLKDLSFLNYANNQNIEKLYIDHNQLTTIDYLPPSLKIFSATFNQISGLEECGKEISRIKSIQQVDFSFTPLRKEGNYKLHIISSAPQLKQIDGIKITKFDLEMATEYGRMLDEQLGLIPSNKFKDLVISKCSQSPSTTFSYGSDVQYDGPSQEQLQKQIEKLQKIMKQTKNHLQVIKHENEIIKEEIRQLGKDQIQQQGDLDSLYNKLRSQCAALQLLNFLQYADQQQLGELIKKKKLQLGCQ